MDNSKTNKPWNEQTKNSTKLWQVLVKGKRDFARERVEFDIDGSVQDCSNSIANALELLQSCTKLSIWISEEYPTLQQPLGYWFWFTGRYLKS